MADGAQLAANRSKSRNLAETRYMAEPPKRRADVSSAGASRVEKPVRTPGVPTSETARAADSVPAPVGPFAILPMKFGRYEVRRELGKGQMGAVYLAFDVGFRRRVRPSC